MRVAVVLALVLATSPALADEPASPPVVLRGTSAPPAPWYEPPAPEVQTVYVPVCYYPVWVNGRWSNRGGVSRHAHAHTAARGR